MMIKVKLEKLDIKFAKQLAKAAGDRRVQNNLRDGLPFPYTEAHAREFISAVQSAENEYTFAITVGGEFAGVISAMRQQNIHFRTAEIGYYVSPEKWGKGIGTQAVTLLCSFVFENTDILRLYAEPFARNVASCRVLEKSGFVCEGVLRKNAVKNGVVEDMKMYSLLREE